MRSMTTISAVIFLVSATVHLAAIEIIMLDNDGWTASANAMCTCIIVIVLIMPTGVSVQVSEWIELKLRRVRC
jgi:ABC-type Fe3+ transport system permease subunit